jgi:hypothetical protein
MGCSSSHDISADEQVGSQTFDEDPPMPQPWAATAAANSDFRSPYLRSSQGSDTSDRSPYQSNPLGGRNGTMGEHLSRRPRGGHHSNSDNRSNESSGLITLVDTTTPPHPFTIGDDVGSEEDYFADTVAHPRHPQRSAEDSVRRRHNIERSDSGSHLARTTLSGRSNGSLNNSAFIPDRPSSRDADEFGRLEELPFAVSDITSARNPLTGSPAACPLPPLTIPQGMANAAIRTVAQLSPSAVATGRTPNPRTINRSRAEPRVRRASPAPFHHREL